MMAGSTMSSKQRPDTLMQDHPCQFDEHLLRRTAGLYIWVTWRHCWPFDRSPLNPRNRTYLGTLVTSAPEPELSLPAPGPAIEYGSALLSCRSHIKIVSDGYRDGVVFEESAVYGCSPGSGRILKSTSFVTGPKLDRVAAGFARILISGQRLFYAGRSRERTPQNERILDRKTSALAQKGCHWVSGIAQHTDPAAGPIGQRFAIPQSPLEHGSSWNAMNEIEEIGCEIGIVRGKLFIGRRNGPSFLFPCVGLSAPDDVRDLSAA